VAHDPVRAALGAPSRPLVALGVAAMAVGWIAAAYFALANPLAVSDDARFVIGFVGLAWTAVPIAVQGVVLVRRKAAREMQWLASLPFPFAHEGYARALGQEHERASLELVLHFARPVDDKQLAVLGDLATDFSIFASLRREAAATLRLQSPAFQSSREPMGTPVHSAMTSYSTAALHRWFRRAAAPYLVALARDHGLASVEVSV